MEDQNIPKQNQTTTKNFILSYSFLAIALIIFVFGFSLGKLSDRSNLPLVGKNAGNGEVKNTEKIPDYLSKDVDFQQFWKVWEYVKNNYVNDDITDSKLFYGALEGLVGSLDDPYSVYFDPEISEKFNQELSGSFEGIGAEIGIRQGVLTVIAPLSGTPAYKAGLRAGDLILKIDDTETNDISLEYAVSIIRGEKGTEVVLNVFTEGDDGPRDVPIIRDTIEIDSVRFSKREKNGDEIANEDTITLEEGDIAYVELLYFNENTLADWNKTIQKILTLNPKGIVLDLRNNPGGFLGTAIEIAGEWVNGNTVVQERLRTGITTSHSANRIPRLNNIPTVVLVNRGSASGSEIVAGALQDYDVATIVGETTFGKGSVQDLREFQDGSSVKLTIAEWLTPLGRSINKQGIEPDVVVEMTREDYDAGRDPQLDKAFEILRGQQ